MMTGETNTAARNRGRGVGVEDQEAVPLRVALPLVIDHLRDEINVPITLQPRVLVIVAVKGGAVVVMIVRMIVEVMGGTLAMVRMTKKIERMIVIIVEEEGEEEEEELVARNLRRRSGRKKGLFAKMIGAFSFIWDENSTPSPRVTPAVGKTHPEARKIQRGAWNESERIPNGERSLSRRCWMREKGTKTAFGWR